MGKTIPARDLPSQIGRSFGPSATAHALRHSASTRNGIPQALLSEDA
jgi:hypothetical protein